MRTDDAAQRPEVGDSCVRAPLAGQAALVRSVDAGSARRLTRPPRIMHDALDLALPLLDRPPRRRQARAREHAGRVSPRRRVRLSHVRVRRQAQRRRRSPSCCTTQPWSAPPTATASRASLPGPQLSRLDAGSWHGRAPCRRAAAHTRSHRRVMCCATASCSTWKSSPRRAPRPPPAHAVAQALRRAVEREPLPGRGAALLSSVRARGPEGARSRRSRSCRAACCSTSGATAGPKRPGRSTASPSSTHFSMLDAAAIAAIHADGMRALTYTVNDPVVAERLIGVGHRRPHHRRGRPLLARHHPFRLTAIGQERRREWAHRSR